MDWTFVRRVARGIIFVSAFAPGARAADAGTDSGVSCASSGDCAAPTPYCHPALHACVACVSDRNCPSGEVCDTATGACHGCLSDADCSVDSPYCDTAGGKCVECLTTKNCGGAGVICKDGACGSCGDGVCGPREGLFIDQGGFFPGGPAPVVSGPRTVCVEDCGSACPTRDLGSTFGPVTITTAGLANLFSSGCGGAAGPEATFLFKVPKTGNYLFNVFGPDGGGVDALISTMFQGGCGGFETGCAVGGGTGSSFVEGDEVLVVVDTETSLPETLTFSVQDQTAGGGGGGGVESDGGKNDQGKSLCLSNARDRGEAVCDGTECACSHCPQDYDDTAVIPGAKAIRDCMDEKKCVGAECYNSGACRSVIDTQGGISSPAFRASAQLESCVLTFACDLSCGGKDAGTRPETDGGAGCEPGRTQQCECGGAESFRSCLADGSGYGPCACDGTPAKKSDDGCGCQIGVARPAGSGVFFGLALAVLVGRSRRRRGRVTLEAVQS